MNPSIHPSTHNHHNSHDDITNPASMHHSSIYETVRVRTCPYKFNSDQKTAVTHFRLRVATGRPAPVAAAGTISDFLSVKSATDKPPAVSDEIRGATTGGIIGILSSALPTIMLGPEKFSLTSPKVLRDASLLEARTSDRLETNAVGEKAETARAKKRIEKTVRNMVELRLFENRGISGEDIVSDGR
mmetsp:Transcript_15252/g.43879  ORF Transcript_15252/g.43879 Transcript_15252/m.43879 type:complete len:187 (+) Transcript_15252:209-769(+)